MSKWSLLRAALAPSSNVQNGAVSSSLSIHRFEGHQRIAKKKSLWSGFRLHVHTSSFPRTASILNHCLMYFQNIDTTEFFLHVESQNEEELRGLIDDILATTSGIEVAHPHSTEAISDIHHLHVDLNQAPSLKTSTSASESSWEAVLRVRHGSLVPVHQCLHFHQYALTCQQGQSKVIWTREPPKQKKINIKELLSDRLYGVDNTGNVCVWPSEPLLLHLLLTEPPLRSLIEGKKVLEIGGGMAGLIGLGLTSYQLCAELCITDGHPHCVLNQKSCLEMNRTTGSIDKNSNVRVELLEWSGFLSGPSSPPQLWDVIIGSDCLFFKDYHDALVKLLDSLLAVHGVAIFFQPSRSGTMELFLSKLPSTFSVEVVENYSQEIYDESLRLRKDDPSYDVDVHYPVLLKIRRVLSL